MTTRYKTVTPFLGVAVLLFVLGVEATPAGSSFDGYYYQKPIFDNDNLDDGTVVHEDDPPLLTYHEDPDERKDTTYLCTIHNCDTGDDVKAHPDPLCSALGCGKLSGKVGLANAAKAAPERKRKDNSTFGEILSLLKTFSFNELSSLQSNLTQKLATMKEEEKQQGKRTTMLTGLNATFNSTADELKMQKENEHFFVSVDKFNKLLESLSDETAAGGHGMGKGKKNPTKLPKHVKTPAIAKKPHKQDLKLKTKNKDFEPTITQFNKLFEELTSSRTLDTLRTKTSGNEPPYGEKLLQLLYAFNNTLNSLPDEKPKKKKFAARSMNLLKDSKNKLPVSITTNKSLAGDVHVKVTVTLDDDANAKQHNTAKRRNQTAVGSIPLNATTTSDENMKFQLASMLDNISGKHVNTAVASSTIEGKAGEGGEEGSAVWAPELKSEMTNISNSMEDGTGSWLKDINSKVQNLSKSIADYSISTLQKMHGGDSGEEGSGLEGSGETANTTSDSSSATVTAGTTATGATDTASATVPAGTMATGATDTAAATIGATDMTKTTATDHTAVTAATPQAGTDGTATSVNVETPPPTAAISTSSAESVINSFLNSTAPSVPPKRLHAFENAFEDDNVNVDKKNTTSQSSLIDSLTPSSTPSSSSSSGFSVESSPAVPPPSTSAKNSTSQASSSPPSLSSSLFSSNTTSSSSSPSSLSSSFTSNTTSSSSSPSASPSSSSFIDFFHALTSNESVSQKPKSTDQASETPSSSSQLLDKTVSSEQASEKPSSQQTSEKPSSQQASEKPSSQQALEKPSSQQASEKPSSQQASEKPSSQQALEKPLSQQASETPLSQQALPPPPPDLSSSKALPGETPLEHLKRLTQNMTKPQELATAEPSSEQALEKPSSQQASEKPSSEQVLEKPLSQKTSETPLSQQALPPPPPDLSSSKALPGETPLEHLKRLTQNMTKPQELATAEPSSEQALEKPSSQQTLEKPSSEQALEKPSSSEQAPETSSSNEQASKKPSSTDQAQEKPSAPSASELALERLTSLARNMSAQVTKSAHSLNSLPPSSLKVLQTSRLPPPPPDLSSSKALPGETPLEHLKRLTQNMTKPKELATAEPGNSTTNKETTELTSASSPILSPAGSAIPTPRIAPADAPGASAAAALFNNYHLKVPEKDLTKDISQIDFSLPPPSTNIYKLKQMSKMGTYNLSNAMVSEKERSSANKILGDLHQLLKINSSTSDAGVSAVSSEAENTSIPFFDDIVNNLRSNHSLTNQNEATKNDGISPNETKSDEPSGEVSKTESAEASASIKELQRLLNHKPNSSSNSFENDEKNKTGAKGSFWYNVNNDLLTNLYQGLKGNGSNAPKPDAPTASERLGIMPDGNLTQKESDKEKVKEEPKGTTSFSLDSSSNNPSWTSTPLNLNAAPSAIEPAGALPSLQPLTTGFGPGKDEDNASSSVPAAPFRISKPGSLSDTPPTLFSQNTTKTPELTPHAAPNRLYNDEAELIEALKTHIKNLSPEKPPENNKIEETPQNAEEQKWYQNTESLVQMLKKNISRTLPSRWYHDEQELVEALKTHLATVSPGKLYAGKTDFAEPAKNTTKSPEDQKWFQDTTSSVDSLRKNISRALPSRWFYDQNELVEALRTHLDTISPGKLYEGKDEVSEADQNKTRSPEELQWFQDTDSSVDSLRKNLTHAIPSRWFHDENELVDALKTHLDTILPNKISQGEKLDLSKHSENVTRSPEEERWFQDTTELVDSLRKNISRAIPSRWFHDESELIDALKTHLDTISMAFRTEKLNELPQNFSSPEEQTWFQETTLLVNSLRKNLTHAMPTRWYHDEDELIEALKTHLDTIQPNRLSHHNSHLQYDEPVANTTGILEKLENPEDQKWFADTTRLMDLLKRNLSDALPDKFSEEETNLLTGLRSNLSAHSPNKWFKDTNQFIDSLKQNLTSVTLYVKDGESRKMFANRKEQGKKVLNKMLLRKKVQEHGNNSSIDKFEKLLTLLSTKKFAGDKNWKHNTYLHLSITTFEDLFKNLVGRAHQSKEDFMKFFSHPESANKERNNDSTVRHNGTSISGLPAMLTSNTSYLDATVKFAKENGVEEEEIAKLQGNTSDYKFRKLLKLLTFKEMLKRFHNQTRNGTLEDRSSSNAGSNDVRIQASFIRKIETLLKLLAFNRIFEDWEEAEGGGEGGGNGAPGAKITNMLSDLGGHITSNVSSSGTVVDKTPSVASTNIMSSSTNGSTSLSNRNVVHGHYSKVAEYMNAHFPAHPAQVTSRVRKIYDEPVQPPFLGYGPAARKSDPAEAFIDNVVKLHTIRKPSEEEKAKTNLNMGKIVKNQVRLRSRVKDNSGSTFQNNVKSPPVSFFDYNQNAVKKSPLMNANQRLGSYTQQQRPQYVAPAPSQGYYGQNIVRASPMANLNLQWNPYTKQYNSRTPAQNMYQGYGGGTRKWANTPRVGFAGEYRNRNEGFRRPEVVRLNHAVVRSSRRKNRLHIATTGSVRSGIHRHH